jgi:hypothetical protein
MPWVSTGGGLLHEPCPSQRSRWDPSQKGGFFVALHWQRLKEAFSVTSNFLGCIPVPLWEPSQKGAWLVLPQAHQK